MKYASFFIVFGFFVFSLLGCVGPDNKTAENTSSSESQQINQAEGQKPADEKTAEIPENPESSQKIVTGFKTPTKKSIAVYLPKNTKKDHPVPVIFIFDPGADGEFPVEMYKSLAEKFGYALVGSNVSKNGQDLSEGLSIFKQMKNEFKTMQAINEKRIYTMGFSGGARVATSIAMSGNNISGVIGCGAGFPGGEDKSDVAFDYFSMAGNQDFNMTELIRLDISLEKSGFNSELYVFDGKHAWPSEDQMKEAFFWLETNAMKKQTASKNDALINETATWFDKLITSFENENRIYDASEAAERAVRFLRGLTITSEFENRLSSLSSDSRYKTQFENKVKIMQEEMGEQNKLLSSFTTMDAAWWANTVKELNRPLPDLERQNMNQRLIAWLGLVAYLSSNNALKKGQVEVAGQFIEIYTTLEPLNPEHAYLGAVLQMQLIKPDAAIEYLKQALMLGFRDFPRIAQDTAFVPLYNRNDFINLVQGKI